MSDKINYGYHRLSLLLLMLYLQDKSTSTSDLRVVDPPECDEGTEELFQTPERPSVGPSGIRGRSVSEESGGSTTTIEYDFDSDVEEGVIPQSQPCWKRGLHYTPLGMKRVHIKKQKLDFGDKNEQ